MMCKSLIATDEPCTYESKIDRKVTMNTPVTRIPASQNGLRPVHPGEILREDYLIPLGLSANALSQALHVPASRINDIILERRGVTVDTAMRLVRYFGGDVQSWMNLQMTYEIKIVEKKKAKRIEREVVPMLAVV
jgi:antitoxin HigA-1